MNVIGRLARALRRLIGLALLAQAAWWAGQAALEWRRPPLVAVDADTGAVLGFRISPLSPAERAEASAREHAWFEMWQRGPLPAARFDNRPTTGLPSTSPAPGDGLQTSSAPAQRHL